MHGNSFQIIGCFYTTEYLPTAKNLVLVLRNKTSSIDILLTFATHKNKQLKKKTNEKT